MICLSIQHIKQLEARARWKPAMLELRLDLIDEPLDVIFSLLNSPAKIIATCRPGKMDQNHRMNLLKTAIESGADLIDLELESSDAYRKELIDHAKSHGREVIISWHDFKRTPGAEALESILADCYSKGADIAKIATLVNEEADNARLLSLYSHPGRKVVLGMGGQGKITRLASIHLGAEFTFASTDPENETAPGQITMEEFDALNKILKSS